MAKGSPSTAHPQPSPTIASRSEIKAHVKTVLSNEISDAVLCQEIIEKYSLNTSTFHKALDSTLLFFLATGIITFVYGLLTRDEYRTFLGGFLSPVAMFVLVMTLRFYNSKDEIGRYTTLGSFICSVLIFFLAIVNFIL